MLRCAHISLKVGKISSAQAKIFLHTPANRVTGSMPNADCTEVSATQLRVPGGQATDLPKLIRILTITSFKNRQAQPQGIELWSCGMRGHPERLCRGRCHLSCRTNLLLSMPCSSNRCTRSSARNCIISCAMFSCVINARWQADCHKPLQSAHL